MPEKSIAEAVEIPVDALVMSDKVSIGVNDARLNSPAGKILKLMYELRGVLEELAIDEGASEDEQNRIRNFYRERVLIIFQSLESNVADPMAAARDFLDKLYEAARQGPFTMYRSHIAEMINQFPEKEEHLPDLTINQVVGDELAKYTAHAA